MGALDQHEDACHDERVPVLPGAEPFSRDGDGDVAVLLCHGFTGSPQGLRDWAEYCAAEGYTVRLPRLPGHGTTWQELNVTRWQDWYATVDREFRSLRRTHRMVVVGGLSMGGSLALRLAEDHGPDVAGLVLVNPAVKHEHWAKPLLPVLMRVIPAFPGIGNAIKKEGVTELAYSRAPLKAANSMYNAWKDVIRDLPEVTQPVLVYRSAQDDVVPAASTALILSRISSTDVTEVVLHDCYHVATLDNEAETIFKGSVEFANRLSAQART